MLPDEHQLLHAVAVLLVPVATEAWIALHEVLQFILGHGGVPLTRIADADLLAGLLKDVADIFFILEIADTLGTDDAFWPFAGYELVEESSVKGLTTVVDIGADTVFLGLALIVVMVVMMVLVAMMIMMVFIVVVMMLMVVIMLMFIVIII